MQAVGSTNGDFERGKKSAVFIPLIVPLTPFARFVLNCTLNSEVVENKGFREFDCTYFTPILSRLENSNLSFSARKRASPMGDALFPLQRARFEPSAGDREYSNRKSRVLWVVLSGAPFAIVF